MSLARDFLRGLYWTLRRDTPAGRSRAVLHMLALLPGLPFSAARLARRLSGDRRPAVAIVALERMGDIVAAEPVARLARTRFPAARICWITTAPHAALPASYPAVDDVLVVRCLTEWMFLQRLNLFQTVWNLHYTDYECPLCCIRHVNPPGLPTVQTYYDFGCLLDVQCLNAGLPRLTDGPQMVRSQADVAAVNALALPRRFFAVHCLSLDPQRSWPANKWRELVARLLAADPSLAVVEVGLDPVVARQDGARQRSLCGKLSVLETAEVIRRADLFIGIDSGPAHLANAVGTPGVILLGAYGGFRSYLPYSGGYGSGSNATLVRTDGPVADLPVETAFAATMARLQYLSLPAS
ncbi:MAG: glycosyltransferase family 9 protein [Rhodospirillales bacterium]|nr:glycosyltransferase family 9 protein [Rhodospirillales bacterium]